MLEDSMKNAIVTGATSGIGAAICRSLLEDGWQVYGIGRDFTGQQYNPGDGFHAVPCDLKKHRDTQYAAERIIKEADSISLLVNCAGVGYFGPHEQISPDKLHEMVAVNIEAPMILSGLLLRGMKRDRGMIINISSVTAKKSNTHGCAYGATKAALTSFGESLFDEVRKYGVRVVNIHPDMTASAFYRNADFKECEEEDARLLPKEVAACVMGVLDIRDGAVITDITIKPQRHGIQRKGVKHKEE